jgi:hypothetical protein
VEANKRKEEKREKPAYRYLPWYLFLLGLIL